MGRAPLTMLVVACVCDADSDEVQDLGLMVAQSQMSKAAFRDQVVQFGRWFHDNKCAEQELVIKADMPKQTFCHNGQSCI